MEPERPLPHPITPEAKPFWEGFREQRLSLVNGMGGMLSAAGTLILSNEQ